MADDLARLNASSPRGGSCATPPGRLCRGQEVRERRGRQIEAHTEVNLRHQIRTDVGPSTLAIMLSRTLDRMPGGSGAAGGSSP
jgi:hypothetical protein